VKIKTKADKVVSAVEQRLLDILIAKATERIVESAMKKSEITEFNHKTKAKRFQTTFHGN
jgi:hypothetical protein